MSSVPDLTVSETAREIRKRREDVVKLIEDGLLRAYDASLPGAKHKSYRVPRQALDDFKAGRSPVQAKPGKRRTRKTQAAGFIEYF